MNRRSMLGFLGIGSVVGPSVANELTAASPIPKQYIDYPSISVSDNKDYINRMQEELSFINADPVKWIADRALNDMKDYMQGYTGINFQHIDPDIRNMKSITELAKMRIYYERRAKRQFEVQKESLTHRIAEIGRAHV